MKCPAAKIIFAHFTAAHSIEKELEIPGDAGNYAE